MNLLQKVATLIRSKKSFINDRLTYHMGFLDLLGELDLPKTACDGDEPDAEKEELDFENFGFSKVEPDEIIFGAGGDWQNPLLITLRLNDEGNIYVSHHEEGFEDDYTIRFEEIMAAVEI